MDDANGIELQTEAVPVDVPRHKPGPRKKEKPRDKKISCRLTEDEKAKGEEYCHKHGITEAKLLRSSYLAATAQEPERKLAWITDAITRLFSDSSAIDQVTLQSRIRDILKKGIFVLALILFGFFLSAAPTIARYFLHVYESLPIIYGPHQSCIYHTGDIGCEMVPDK